MSTGLYATQVIPKSQGNNAGYKMLHCLAELTILSNTEAIVGYYQNIGVCKHVIARGLVVASQLLPMHFIILCHVILKWTCYQQESKWFSHMRINIILFSTSEPKPWRMSLSEPFFPCSIVSFSSFKVSSSHLPLNLWIIDSLITHV